MMNAQPRRRGVPVPPLAPRAKVWGLPPVPRPSEGAAAPGGSFSFGFDRLDFDLGRSRFATRSGFADPGLIGGAAPPGGLRSVTKPCGVVSGHGWRFAAVLRSGPDVAAGASGPVITEALRKAGIVPDRHIPGESLIYKVFDIVGETLPAMLLTRQAARLANGWNRGAVRAVGEQAAERLIEHVQPFARVLIDQHHEAGRKVVIATTSPFDLVKPLAGTLGVDDVIATRYGERNGAYDGTIDGLFVWGPGKLQAVRIWAKHHGVDVDGSWAYSDSIYDLPLPEAVRHPGRGEPRSAAGHRLRGAALAAAVPRRPRGRAQARRPRAAAGDPGLRPAADVPVGALRHRRAEAHPGERSRDPRGEPPQLLRRAGGGLRGGADRAAHALPRQEGGLRRTARRAAGLGARRHPRRAGTGSDEPLAAAAEASTAASWSRSCRRARSLEGRAFFEPVLVGRWESGPARRAHQGPVIPVGLWGTEQVWPRNAKLPNILAVGHPPIVRIRVGRPVELKYRSAGRQADHGGDRRPAARQGPRAPRARPGRAGPHPALQLQGRPERGRATPPRLRLTPRRF